LEEASVDTRDIWCASRESWHGVLEHRETREGHNERQDFSIFHRDDTISRLQRLAGPPTGETWTSNNKQRLYVAIDRTGRHIVSAGKIEEVSKVIKPLKKEFEGFSVRGAGLGKNKQVG
jgi:hypothetical protein